MITKINKIHVFGINTTSDISKLLYVHVIILQVKFETILKCY